MVRGVVERTHTHTEHGDELVHTVLVAWLCRWHRWYRWILNCNNKRSNWLLFTFKFSLNSNNCCCCYYFISIHFYSFLSLHSSIPFPFIWLYLIFRWYCYWCFCCCLVHFAERTEQTSHTHGKDHERNKLLQCIAIIIRITIIEAATAAATAAAPTAHHTGTHTQQYNRVKTSANVWVCVCVRLNVII